MMAIASRRRTAMVTFSTRTAIGIAADDAFVQDLDPRALDEAEFDQPAFKLGVGQCRACLAGGEMLDHAGEAAPGKPERQLRLDVAGFGHGL